MGEAIYRVVESGERWTVEHDGQREGKFATKEAAFEAIVGAASNAIKFGHDVIITVPGRDTGNATALGAETN